MLELLQFIFSSFWIFLGTIILLGLAGDVVVKTAQALRRK